MKMAIQETLPFTVLFTTGWAAGGSSAVATPFGISIAFPPASWGHTLSRAGSLHSTNEKKGLSLTVELVEVHT